MYIVTDMRIFIKTIYNITIIYESRSFFTLNSSPNMVAISPCMKAQGTLELASGHFSPLGQYT